MGDEEEVDGSLDDAISEDEEEVVMEGVAGLNCEEEEFKLELKLELKLEELKVDDPKVLLPLFRGVPVGDKGGDKEKSAEDSIEEVK